MKWEFVEEDKQLLVSNIGPVIVTRIRALERRYSDGVNDDVMVGDLGGYIERESNLSRRSLAWVANGACVYGNAKVCGDAIIGKGAQLFGRAMLMDEVMVSGLARIGGTAQVRNSITIVGALVTTGNTMIYGSGTISANYGELDISDLRSIYLHDGIQISAYRGYGVDIRGPKVLGEDYGKEPFNNNIKIYGDDGFIIKSPAM